MIQLPEISPATWPAEQPILKRANLAQHRAASAQLDTVRSQAEQLLQMARAQASQIQDEAYQRGVVLGVQAALAPLLELATQLAQEEKALRAHAVEVVQDCFGEVLATVPALQAVLDRVMAARGLQSGAALQMSIPPEAADCADALRAHSAAQGIALTVDIHDERGRLAIECAGHHWQTDIAALHDCTHHMLPVPLLEESAIPLRFAQALHEAAAVLEA